MSACGAPISGYEATAACATRPVDARSRLRLGQGGRDEALLCARRLLALTPYRDAGGGRQLRPGAGNNQEKKTKSGADYWTINGKGQVPVLEFDNGERLTEGPVIVQWIADQYPAAGLVPPAGKPERYRVQEWLNFITSELHKSFGPVFRLTTPDAYKAISKENLGKRFPGTRDDAWRHFAGGPIVTVKLPTPSISHSSLSPGTVAATPDGVPVMMMSPAASATISESLPMTSGTFQIICARSPSCRSLPLALSAMRPLLG